MFPLKPTVTVAIVACCLSLLLATTQATAAHGLNKNQRPNNSNFGGVTFNDKARAAARKLSGATSKCCSNTVCGYCANSGISAASVAQSSCYLTSMNGVPLSMPVSCGPPCKTTTYKSYGTVTTDSGGIQDTTLTNYAGKWGTHSCPGQTDVAVGASEKPKKNCRVVHKRGDKITKPNLPNNGYLVCVCELRQPEGERTSCSNKCLRSKRAANKLVNADEIDGKKIRAHYGNCPRYRTD